MVMIDIDFARKVPGLRRLKWLCTLSASVATMLAFGILINWGTGGNSYHWSAWPIALAVVGIAVAARHAIGLKLDDRQ